MNATRMVMWMLGALLIVGGALMMYFEAGLNRWVSLGVLGAGLLLFIGLAVMTFAGGAPSDTPAHVTRHGGSTEHGPTVIVERSAPVVVERSPIVVERPTVVDTRGATFASDDQPAHVAQQPRQFR